MAGHILIIDDDERLAAMVGDYLGKAGFRVNHHANAEDGLAALKRARFDALILDVMLPDVDGFDVCRRVRVTSDIPILMLTARGEATDRIVGLELGADDYLPKPFNPHELLARLKAILRRSQAANRRDSVLRFGRLEIDRDAHIARVDGRECPLTNYQFALLLAMAQRAGRVMSREELMDLAKGEPLDAFDRSIDVHISRIRAEIEDDVKRPRRIITVRGAGYVFARSQDGNEAE
jgi:DNA-binding response OmpR family regulator